MTRVPAPDAIKAIKKTRDGTGDVLVTMQHGWEDVLPKTKEDDPGSLIIWHDNNVAATVAAFNAAIAQGIVDAAAITQGLAVEKVDEVVPPPAWLINHDGGPVRQITIPGLKSAILTRVATNAGGGGVVGNAMIAPNTMEEYVQVYSELCCVGFDPFFKKYAVFGPIGSNYVLKDNLRSNRAVRHVVAPPAVGLGVPVFD